MNKCKMAGKVQIVEGDAGGFDAGGKAPSDAARIAAEAGFRTIAIPCVTGQPQGNRVLAVIHRTFRAFGLLFKIPCRALVFIQYPCILFGGRPEYVILRMLLKLKKVRLITLVHDLDGLRSRRPGAAYDPKNGIFRVMADSEKVIVHNASMIKWCEEVYKAPASKLIDLRIFDYLTTAPFGEPESDNRCVTIAGNLQSGKSGYLRKLKEIKDVPWRLYGPCYDEGEIGGANIAYKGCVEPAVLPGLLTTGFGLVWDGESVESCEGLCGKYLLYNNPHKLSLYLASGLPVIIWSEAAEAPFVREHGVGLTVTSLLELGDALPRLPREKYEVMRRNARALAARLRGGEFLRGALEEACR